MKDLELDSRIKNMILLPLYYFQKIFFAVHDINKNQKNRGG